MTEQEISFELSADDLRRANLRRVTAHRAVRKVFLTSLVVGPGLAFLLLLLFGYSLLQAAVAGLFAVPVAGGVVLWRLRKRLQPTLDVDERLVGSYTVRIDRRRVRANTPAGAWGERWADVDEVRTSSDVIDIILGDLRGIPIPRRAFPDPEAADRFAAAALAAHRDAQHRSGTS